MALNIDVNDGFGFMDSDSDVPSKLSPTLKQPPVSPIESESSGISSLDSDDLKKQLLSSPPTISIISHDQEEEEEEEDDDEDNEQSEDSEEKDEREISDVEEEEEEDEGEGSDEAAEIEKVEEKVEMEEPIKTQIPELPPMQVIYQNRNVLNLAGNIWGGFIQYTVLPDNNLNFFFQNRAQYWRLGEKSSSELLDSQDKCSCCDFSYPSLYHHHQPNSQRGLSNMAKNNAITDSLLTFLKNHHADYNINNVMPNNHIKPQPQQQHTQQRPIYNTTAPYAAYQIIQQQYQQNNGYYNNTMNGFNNQQMNPFNNNGNGGGYNTNTNNNNGNSALALLNLMNQSRNNITAGAFQQAMNNNSRYNNNYNNNNNGYGLYKQF